MDEKYLMKHSSELVEETNLSSFISFNSNTNPFSSGSCFPEGLFAYQRVDQNQMEFTKDEEDDSGIQYSLPSDSSMSTPDIVNSIYTNNLGTDNLSQQGSFEQRNDFWLKVDFLSPSSFFYKDAEKPSSAAKLTYLPNRENPVLYVAKGRIIELATETNFCPPMNSVMKFDVYSLKGTREEPVYGTSSENHYENSDQNNNPNLCFIQATEQRKVAAQYVKCADGFVAMIVPLKQSSCSISVVFPFLNFKCHTSSKKIVFLKISVCNGSRVITCRRFQLVSCTSPNRDFKRHFEKLSTAVCALSPSKKLKMTTTEESNELIVPNQRSDVTDNPQYVIMTENYDIWKILHIVHQQLNEHFNSSKK